MDYFDEFSCDFLCSIKTCKKIIMNYPNDLRDECLNYLSLYDNIENCKKYSYGFCVFLPYWIGKSFSINKNITHDISVSNIFLLLYYLIQDNIFDSINVCYKNLIPVSNVFIFEAISCYNKIVASSHLFTKYAKYSSVMWSNSLLKEKRTFKINKQEDSILETISNKQYPLNLVMIASCIYSKKETKIPNLIETLNLILTGMQLLDDYIDWNEDLKNGNHTYFLFKVQKIFDIENFEMLTKKDVKIAIYLYDLVNEILILIRKHNKEIGILTETNNIYYLKFFHNNLLNKFSLIVNEIEKHKHKYFKINDELFKLFIN